MSIIQCHVPLATVPVHVLLCSNSVFAYLMDTECSWNGLKSKLVEYENLISKGPALVRVVVCLHSFVYNFSSTPAFQLAIALRSAWPLILVKRKQVLEMETFKPKSCMNFHPHVSHRSRQSRPASLHFAFLLRIQEPLS